MTSVSPALSAPIPFVTLSDDGSFDIAPEAVTYLQQIRGDIAVVAIAGLYRTGKSYLLNLLLGRDQESEMFDVGATVNACTKGIWIWGQPVAAQSRHPAFKHLSKDTTIVFMDTEGLGSTQRSQTQDTRIFALALLLSSLFIYNSRGVIDASAIEDLSLVVNLTKYIQAKAHADEDGSELSTFFPDFLWVVRDFTLQLQEDGRKVTSKDYFESALKQQPPLTEEVVQKNRIRSLLSTFFPSRDCVTMVRPLTDEKLLRSLIKQPYESLRPEFREEMEVLRNRLSTLLKPKTMMAKALNGSMLVSLTENYVAAFNSGSSPVITSVWDRVLESQCDQALDSAKRVFQTQLDAAIAEKTNPVMVNGMMRARPLEDAELADVYAKALEAAEQELLREDITSYSSIEAYLLQLSEYSLDVLQTKYSDNDAVSAAYNKELLQELYNLNCGSKSLDDLTPASGDGFQQLQDRLAYFNEVLDGVVTQYNSRALGAYKTATLNAFLVENMIEGIFEWGAMVKTVFRSQEAKRVSDIANTQQRLRSIEAKVRVEQDMLVQQKDSYERAVESISERLTNERDTLSDDIKDKQLKIEQASLQVERLRALHQEALDRLDKQIEEAKDERNRLESDVRDIQARRETERQEAQRQLLENERNFHNEEKGLLQSQQKFMEKVVELERQLGDLETDQVAELYRIEKDNQEEISHLSLQYQDEQDALQESADQDMQALRNKQEEEIRALQRQRDDKNALAISLRKQLEEKEARKREQANQFFGEECSIQ
ncbi:hypothetical protein DVH05_000783 [Phytophthora capsici]|nr:hypothetical protein DVH05_000783 [Phytophthora capsici]|eukprot:jgi/Phyca11/544701/estExt2_Genewise1Plus.C_PHYCAscaffold_150448